MPELDDDELHQRLYPREPAPPRYPTPDFAMVQRELATKGVTRKLLWKEYKAAQPDGCPYSAFCRDYDAWLGRQDAVMRFEHTPGEKLFVDYAGKTMAVVDRHSGEYAKEVRSRISFAKVLCNFINGLEANMGKWPQ